MRGTTLTGLQGTLLLNVDTLTGLQLRLSALLVMFVRSRGPQWSLSLLL